MHEIWQQLPRELLKNIFKYLPPEYIKTEITRWLTKKEILYMLNKIIFEESIKNKNYTACILYKNIYPNYDNKVDWYWISRSQKLSEDFIREFQNKVDWLYILERQKLSENFIREFQYKVDWEYISRCQKLSENFIREFQDKVYWEDISINQKLSEEFILEFLDKVDLKIYSMILTSI